MSADDRLTPGLFLDVLDALERHGYHHHDKQHTGQAMGVIRDLAHVYEGAQDHPVAPVINPAPFPQTASEPSGQDNRGAVLVRASDLKTVLIALDIAADDMRDRTEMCTDCPDQSCPACQSRLRDAQAYDHLTDRMLQATETAPATHYAQTEPASPPRQSGPAAGKEAGQ